jgi:hypothetical protein
MEAATVLALVPTEKYYRISEAVASEAAAAAREHGMKGPVRDTKANWSIEEDA